MGEKNPEPVLGWCRKYLHHEDKEIRREICHGIELRGRTHPQDIVPMLRGLEFDKTARVRNTLVHVLGQIAYKKGCLEAVIEDGNETSWRLAEKLGFKYEGKLREAEIKNGKRINLLLYSLLANESK